MLMISNFQPCMDLIFIMVLKDVFHLIVCIRIESSSSLSEKKQGKREKGSLIFALFTYLNLKAIFFQVLFFKYKITTISTVYHLWYFKGSAIVKALGKISIVNMQTVTDMCPVNIIYSPSRRVLGK